MTANTPFNLSHSERQTMGVRPMSRSGALKHRLFTLARILLFGGLLVSPSYATPAALHGDWIGQIDYGKEWQRINFHITTDKEGFKGTLDLPQQGRNGLPLNKIVADGSHLLIEWQGRSGLATYDGQIKDGVIAGEFKQGASKGAFRLVHVAKASADLKLYGEYAGSYQLGPDRFVDLAPFAEDEDRPIFFDSKTRRTGVLYALSETEFFTGPSYGVMFPMDTRVTFVRNR